MNINLLCYELYKLDWMRRISIDRQMDELKNWYQEMDEVGKLEYPYADWINDNGYGGELYVCFGEFMNAEYRDAAYMESLLGNMDLIREYRNARCIGKYTRPDGKVMRQITVYCDSTDLYTQEEIEAENLCELDFPEDIVREYFEKKIQFFHPSIIYEEWIEDSYTADDTDGLFDFAKEKGFFAKR